MQVLPTRGSLATRRVLATPTVEVVLDAIDTDAPACATVFEDRRPGSLVTSGGYGHPVGKSLTLRTKSSFVGRSRPAARIPEGKAIENAPR